MAPHMLVIEPDTDHAARFPHAEPRFVCRIECPDTAACPGFQECDHDGYHPMDEDSPAYGASEITIHGVHHAWSSALGWCVDYAGCPVAASEPEPPDDLLVRPGRYPVGTDWDEIDCHLYLLHEAGESMTDEQLHAVLDTLRGGDAITIRQADTDNPGWEKEFTGPVRSSGRQVLIRRDGIGICMARNAAGVLHRGLTRVEVTR